MPNRFASGKYAIAECDRCAGRYMLKELRKQVVKTKLYSIKVCPSCWDPDQPQLQLGMYPVDDPQAVREPRPDVSYQVSGTSGLQLDLTGNSTPDGYGYSEGGSRIIQWGWNPVGGSRFFDADLTPNNLVLAVELNPTTVPSAILRGVVGYQPEQTQFITTKINGRSIADILDTGIVGPLDYYAYTFWINGTLTDTAQIAYIEQVMNPYMLANPLTYVEYMTIV